MSRTSHCYVVYIIIPCGVCTLRPMGLQIQVVPEIEFHEYHQYRSNMW